MTGLIVVAALLGQVRIQDDGADKGLANRINCSGVGVTCAVTKGTASIVVSGTAADVSCTGCISDNSLAQNYAAPGSCPAGSYISEVKDGLPPTCGVPVDTDTKGSYTFGGYVPVDFATEVPFARFTALNSGMAVYLHFVIAPENPVNPGSAFVDVVREANGNAICRVSVSCTGSDGEVVTDDCKVDDTQQYVIAGEKYFLRWATGACGGNPPGGNATFGVDEDETP